MRQFVFTRTKQFDGSYGDIQVTYLQSLPLICDYGNGDCSQRNNILYKQKKRIDVHGRKQYVIEPTLIQHGLIIPAQLLRFVDCVLSIMPIFLQHIIKKLTVPLQSYAPQRLVSDQRLITPLELQNAGGSMQDKYYLKYLKYKQKYLELKNKK